MYKFYIFNNNTIAVVIIKVKEFLIRCVNRAWGYEVALHIFSNYNEYRGHCDTQFDRKLSTPLGARHPSTEEKSPVSGLVPGSPDS